MVEDRRDPIEQGRVKVRILGFHTPDKKLIPTCELLWAYPYTPITNAAMNGIGFSPTGPVEGTWVFGFFRDSASAQDPVVFGTIPGIPKEIPNPCIGFFDPSEPFHELDKAPRKIYSRHYPNDGTGAQLKNEKKAKLYPREVHPWGSTVGESDVNRLARNKNIDDTIIGVKRRQRDVNVPVAFAHPKPGRQWNEPETTYDARYPYNHVYESESGHIVEFDDTPGKERIHLFHRSGTFVEIHGSDGKEGDTVIKIVGNATVIIQEKARVHIQNAASITVDGETNLYCRDTLNIQADGDMNVRVGGNYTEKIKGNRTVEVGGNNSSKVSGTEKQSAGGSFTMASGGNLSADAPRIDFNSGKGSPDSPEIPSFPSPTGRKENVNESGQEPQKEEKQDPDPKVCSGQEDC